MDGKEISWLETRLRRWIGWIALVFAFQIVLFTVLFINGYMWDEGNDHSSRVEVCLILVIWGFGYYVLDKTVWKTVFGLGQIAFGLALDWYQLGKMNPLENPHQDFERLAFFVAGMVAIAHGWKDLLDGSIRFEKTVRQWRKDREAGYIIGLGLNHILLSTHQASESSAAPSPEKRDPEAM